MSIQSVNPATDEVLETFTSTTPEELERIVARAHAAFVEWRSVPFKARADRMREAARLLRKGMEHHAVTMTLEMGKPIVQAEAEVEKCAACCAMPFRSRRAASRMRAALSANGTDRHRANAA